MDNSEKNLSMNEAKKVSLEFKINSLQQVLLERLRSFSTLSNIGLVTAGLLISFKSDLIRRKCLAISALIIMVFIAMISFAYYLCMIRSDVNGLSEKIKSLPSEDWSKPLKEEPFKIDYTIEILFFLFVLTLLLFGLSFIP